MWGGTTKLQTVTIDVRIRFDEGAILFAARCTSGDHASVDVAVSGKARISNDLMEVLESKEDVKTIAGTQCRASIQAGRTPQCGGTDASQTDCFHLSGTKLTMYGSSALSKLELTRISD